MDFITKLIPALFVVLQVGCTATHVSKISAPLQVMTKIPVVHPEITRTGPIKGKCVKIRFLFMNFGVDKQADGIKFSSNPTDVEVGVNPAFLLYPPLYVAMYLTKKSNKNSVLPDYKKAALYDACQKAGVDAIIDPQYTVKKKAGPLWLTETTNCTVTGTGVIVNSVGKIKYILPSEPVVEKSIFNEPLAVLKSYK